MNSRHRRYILIILSRVRSYAAAGQRSAQRKAFAAFVGKFFIPFPGTKISGEYTGGERRGIASGIASFFVRRQNFGFNPEPGPHGARVAGNRPPRVRRAAVRCGARRRCGGSGSGTVEGGLYAVRKEG